MSHGADWYPDPTGRHEHRYYDGTAWTDHVSDGGITGRDPLDGGPSQQKPSKLDRFDDMMHVGKHPDPASIQRQVEGTARHGGGAAAHVTGGGILLQLTRPAKVFKSTVIVTDGQGRELGRIAQENVFGKISFAYEVDGQRVGGIRGENWRAWNWRIEDASGAEIARITKTFEGIAKTLFTTADNYVVHLHHKPPEPLHHLVVASAIAVDTALKQDARGLG